MSGKPKWIATIAGIRDHAAWQPTDNGGCRCECGRTCVDRADLAQHVRTITMIRSSIAQSYAKLATDDPTAAKHRWHENRKRGELPS